VQITTDDVAADRAKAQEILAAMKIDMAKALGV
jgi:hypothetical protein